MKKNIDKIFTLSNKVFRTDFRYLANGGFWMIITQLFNAFAGMLLLIAFANLLPKSAYGTYQFVLSVSAVIAAISLTGLSETLTKNLAKGIDQSLMHTLKTALLWSIFIPITAGLLALYYFYNGNTTLAFSFIAVGSLVPFMESFRLYHPYLLGQERFKKSALFGMWRKPIPVLSLFLTLAFTTSPLILIVVYLFSNSITLGMLFISLNKETSGSVPLNKQDIRYSLHLSFLNLINLCAQNLDRILIFKLLGASALASYVIARTPLKHIQGFVGLISKVAFPKLARNDFKTLQDTLPRKVNIFIIFIIFIIFLYIFAIPYLYKIIFPKYPESVILTQALSLMLLTAPLSLYSKALTAHQKTKSLYIIKTSTPILRSVLLITLIPLFGLWGVVYAILGTHVFLNLAVRTVFSMVKT